MTNYKKLIICYNLFKKKLIGTHASVHVYSFLKRMPITFLKKMHKQNYRILHKFLLITKEILNKYLLEKSFLFRNNFTFKKDIYFSNIHIFFLKQYQNLIAMSFFLQKKKQIFFIFKKIYFLYNVYVNLLFQLLYFRYHIVALPKKIRKKTVLRSPHIDKRSREQFEKITRHFFISIPFFFFDISSIIKVPSTFGIEIQQRITYKR